MFRFKLKSYKIFNLVITLWYLKVPHDNQLIYTKVSLDYLQSQVSLHFCLTFRYSEVFLFCFYAGFSFEIFFCIELSWAGLLGGSFVLVESITSHSSKGSLLPNVFTVQIDFEGETRDWEQRGRLVSTEQLFQKYVWLFCINNLLSIMRD